MAGLPDRGKFSDPAGLTNLSGVLLRRAQPDATFKIVLTQ
jgi:hypothetical protein